jgi:hypothetical protein
LDVSSSKSEPPKDFWIICNAFSFTVKLLEGVDINFIPLKKEDFL